MLTDTDATESQIVQAVAINDDARLDTLKIALLVFAAIAAVAVFSASRLPKFRPHEVPDPNPRASLRR